MAQAHSAAAHDADVDSDSDYKDHLWDFIQDGLNMLIRSATLQVCWPMMRRPEVGCTPP